MILLSRGRPYGCPLEFNIFLPPGNEQGSADLRFCEGPRLLVNSESKAADFRRRSETRDLLLFVFDEKQQMLEGRTLTEGRKRIN
jgi:hypothetical protein